MKRVLFTLVVMAFAGCAVASTNYPFALNGTWITSDNFNSQLSSLKSSGQLNSEASITYNSSSNTITFKNASLHCNDNTNYTLSIDPSHSNIIGLKDTLTIVIYSDVSLTNTTRASLHVTGTCVKLMKYKTMYLNDQFSTLTLDSDYGSSASGYGLYLDNAQFVIQDRCRLSARGSYFGVFGFGDSSKLIVAGSQTGTTDIRPRLSAFGRNNNALRGKIELPDGYIVKSPDNASITGSGSFYANGSPVKNTWLTIGPDDLPLFLYDVQMKSTQNWDEYCAALRADNRLNADGSISYDPATNTLTMDNAKLTVDAVYNSVISNGRTGALGENFEYGIPDFKIMIKGDCSITQISSGRYTRNTVFVNSYGHVELLGDGKLTFNNVFSNITENFNLYDHLSTLKINGPDVVSNECNIFATDHACNVQDADTEVEKIQIVKGKLTIDSGSGSFDFYNGRGPIVFRKPAKVTAVSPLKMMWPVGASWAEKDDLIVVHNANGNILTSGTLVFAEMSPLKLGGLPIEKGITDKRMLQVRQTLIDRGMLNEDAQLWYDEPSATLLLRNVVVPKPADGVVWDSPYIVNGYIDSETNESVDGIDLTVSIDGENSLELPEQCAFYNGRNGSHSFVGDGKLNVSTYTDNVPPIRIRRTGTLSPQLTFGGPQVNIVAENTNMAISCIGLVFSGGEVSITTPNGVPVYAVSVDLQGEMEVLQPRDGFFMDFGGRYMLADADGESFGSGTAVIGKRQSLRGDLNEDGSVNTGDVSELYMALLNGWTDAKYDLNGDGNVNSGDVSELYKIILGN